MLRVWSARALTRCVRRPGPLRPRARRTRIAPRARPARRACARRRPRAPPALARVRPPAPMANSAAAASVRQCLLPRARTTRTSPHAMNWGRLAPSPSKP
ncbi:hypothetical protein DAT35_17205 [Vitiosangium sp. GDMCC 1.1324]|nr:hypothetical protein DAT35_17205 [Vitiosangium sp. GDMCC 1.1324]